MNSYYKNIKVVVFDFDGVILDTSFIKSGVFQDMFKKYPIFYERMWLFHLKNKGTSRKFQFDYLVRNLLEEKGDVASKHIEELMSQYKESVASRLLKAQYIEGAYKAIVYSEKKYTTYIVSNAPTSELHSILENKKIDKYFRDVFSSETGINKSQALNQIINREKLSPECLLFIGDTCKDQISAKESLVKFVGIENSMSNFFDDYGIRIKNMNELYIELSKVNN
ncbi:HAD family hydrolase [Candidatus Woesearchaeota archaeon]|nr:HAD family hydrolase [Candidatus Woesearchaeota archaeon]